MNITDRRGQPVPEVTVTLDAHEIVDLLQGLADLVEGKREHLHFKHPGGPELVVRLGPAAPDEDALERQMDWYLGPLVLLGAVFLVLGVITFVRWAAGLIG